MSNWESLEALLPVGESEEDKEKRLELWKQFNVTNPKSLELFELDAGIQQVLQCQQLFEAKPVIRRAHRYAREVNPNGPDGSLEFCEFRLLLVYLKGLFEVYRVFCDLDSSIGSRDHMLSLDELAGSQERLKALGIPQDDIPALWEKLKGSNEGIDFNEFADWATRQGMAGPELLGHQQRRDEGDPNLQQNMDQDLASKLKETLKGWSRCQDGMVPVEHVKELLVKFLPDLDEDSIMQLTQGGIVGDDDAKVNVDAFIDSIVLDPYR